MDRKLARKNLRSGLIAGAACRLMFGITFLPPRSTCTRERPRPRPRRRPAGEEIHLPGPTLIPFVSAIGITLIVVGTTINCCSRSSAR